MKKIIITDSVDKKCIELLETEGYNVTYNPGMPKEEIKKVISDYNGLIVRSDTKVTPDLIELMDNMEVIGRAGAGVDNIDLEAATRKGIIVMNTPGGNTISAAEHTMALMLSMCRNIPQSNQALRSGKWERKKFKGTELFEKTLGIIGLGKIGREVAARAKAFGMKVLAFDPVLSGEVADKINVNLVSLNEVLNQSDIITVHVPVNEETRDLISSDALGKCKDGVKIINCARGGIINENDLVKALDSGKVSAAAFDVYEKEPPDFSGALIQNPKVVTTPHLGASTEEAQEKVALQIAEQIIEMFNNKGLRGAVNTTAAEAGIKEEIKPYANLAENLGALHSQLSKGQLKKININYSGEMLHNYIALLSAGVLKGFLSRKLTSSVNLINAPLLAKEMGIIVNETKSGDNLNYKNLMTVKFVTDQMQHSLGGTVFGNNEVRIVYVDNYHLELKPEGAMLFYFNIDKPGMLANVGKVLAESDINIAGLSLGRFEAGKEALTVINVDSEINPEVLSSIESISGVHDVLAVKL